MKTSRGIVLALAALVLTGGVERKAATLNNNANQLFDKKEFDAATKLYDEAQTRAPESPEIAYNLGNALYRQGKKQDAIPMLLRGAQSQDPALRQKSLYNLGNALHDTGKLPEAVHAYRQSLAIDPHDRDAKINYEKSLQELQQQQQQQQQNGGNNSNQKNNQNQNQQQQNQGGQGNSQQDEQQGKNEPQQGENQSEQQQDDKGQQGEPKDESQGQPQEEQSQPQDQQGMAGFDSVAAGDLSREEAMRILEAMRQQETELQKAKALQQKARTRRVDKDW
jgi:hypothetical protein